MPGSGSFLRPLRGLKSPRRAYATISRAETLFSPTPELLESHLSRTALDDPSSSATLFLLSTSLPSLPNLLAPLQKAFPRSTGSFSHSAPGSEPTISIATFHNARIWQSTLTGRKPAEVGRWHRPSEDTVQDKKGDQIGDLNIRRYSQDWDQAWDADQTVEKIPDLEGFEWQPTACAASTEWHVPICHQIWIDDGGNTVSYRSTIHLTVWTRDPIFGFGRTGFGGTAITYSGLQSGALALLSVGRQGNMLLALENHPNPTQLLIQAIQRRGGAGLTKDEDFYLAFLDSAGQITKAVRILSGDPSRGALSLDTEDSLKPGEAVQRKTKFPLVPLTPGTLTFGSLSKSEVDEEPNLGKPRVEQGFLAFSEEGFIHSAHQASVSTAAGGRIMLK